MMRKKNCPGFLSRFVSGEKRFMHLKMREYDELKAELKSKKKISDFDSPKPVSEPDVIEPKLISPGAIDLDVVEPIVVPVVEGSGTIGYSEPFEIPELSSEIY